MKSFAAFMAESFNPFGGISGEMPTDFVPGKDKDTSSLTDRSWTFLGKDGKQRKLVVKVGGEHADEGAGVMFNVYPANEKDFSAMESHKIEAHGRGHDVMNVVANTIKDHVRRIQPETVSWLASKAHHRLYKAAVSKMRLNSYRMLKHNKGDPVAVMVRNY